MLRTDLELPSGKIVEFEDRVSHTASEITSRVESIDMLRGIAIILMILGHCRNFVGLHIYSPTDLTQSYPLLFLTRIIPGMAAPNFVFLAGIAVSFIKWPKKKLSLFLLKRGVWLILLELLLINQLFATYVRSGHLYLQILWVSGISMIILAFLIHLPKKLILTLSLLIICGHNYFDTYSHPIWDALHSVQDYGLFVSYYPIIPWFAVMSLGYSFSGVFKLSSIKRRILLQRLGLGIILAFVIIRWSNVYGNPIPWQYSDRGAVFTVLSFLHNWKYPPSLLYLMFGIGFGIFLLPILEQMENKLSKFLATIGQTPLFCYICHLVIINLFAGPINLYRYGTFYIDERDGVYHPYLSDQTLLPTYLVWFGLLLCILSFI